MSYLLTKKKILLVDGDEGIRKSLSLFFRSRGYNLHTVESATQALMAIEEALYDIILCEQLLPDMDGLIFFEIVKNRCHEVIKVLISVYGNNTALEDIPEKCIDYVLTKPFSGEEIEAAMVELVKAKRIMNRLNDTKG